MHEDVTGLPIPQDGDGLRVGVIVDRFLEPIQLSITSPSAARLEARKAGLILRELTCLSSMGSWRLPEDIQQLMHKIREHCKKIRVAKVNLLSSSTPPKLSIPFNPKQKGSSQLLDLCDNLTNKLSDRSITLQQSNYTVLKRPVRHPPPSYTPLMRNDSALISVEVRLAVWSKYNYPKRLCKFISLSPPHPRNSPICK